MDIFSVNHLKNAQRIVKGIRLNDEPIKVIPFKFDGGEQHERYTATADKGTQRQRVWIRKNRTDAFFK